MFLVQFLSMIDNIVLTFLFSCYIIYSYLLEHFYTSDSRISIFQSRREYDFHEYFNKFNMWINIDSSKISKFFHRSTQMQLKQRHEPSMLHYNYNTLHGNIASPQFDFPLLFEFHWINSIYLINCRYFWYIKIYRYFWYIKNYCC